MIFLGVDVGGTKTEAILVDDEGKVLSYFRGGPGNYQSIGKERAFKEIRKVVDGTLEKAKVNKEDVTFAYFGVAGADTPKDFEIVRSILNRLGLKRFDFDNDGRIALRSGTFDDIGIMVSCGTGSISYAFDGKNMHRAGGFSFFFGERLGSFYIAGLVTSAIMRAKDGRSPKTKLEKIVEEKIKMKVEDLMRYEYFDERRPINFVPLVTESLFEGFREHDFMATKIFVSIVDEVLNIVEAHRRVLNFEKPIKLVLEGTFFKKAEKSLIEMIKSALGDEFEIVVPKHDPIVGAVLLAMEKAGLSMNRKLFNKLVDSYLEFKRRLER